jgi:hypothetical protein
MKKESIKFGKPCPVHTGHFLEFGGVKLHKNASYTELQDALKRKRWTSDTVVCKKPIEHTVLGEAKEMQLKYANPIPPKVRKTLKKRVQRYTANKSRHISNPKPLQLTFSSVRF